MPQRSYKLRAYLTSEQTAAVERWSHHLRWVWSNSLRRQSLAYRRRQESVSDVDVSMALTALQNFFAGKARYSRFPKAGLRSSGCRDSETLRSCGRVFLSAFRKW